MAEVPLDMVGAHCFLLLRVVVWAHNLQITRVGISQIMPQSTATYRGKQMGKEIWQGFLLSCLGI